MEDRTAHKVLRIRKSLDLTEVRWGAVLDLLCSRHRYNFRDADKILKRFLTRLELAFNATWFTGRALSHDESTLVTAVCELHGADAVDLESRRSIEAGPIHLSYAQTVRCEPAHGRGKHERARCSGDITVSALGRTCHIKTLSRVVAAQVALFLVATLTYTIFVGAFLYGFATFLILTQEPAKVAMAATRRLDLLLGLLLFLVGTAGIFGRALRNTGLLLWEKLRKAPAI